MSISCIGRKLEHVKYATHHALEYDILALADHLSSPQSSSIIFMRVFSTTGCSAVDMGAEVTSSSCGGGGPSSSDSSSLASPGFLKTSSVPFTKRLFFIGTSGRELLALFCDERFEPLSASFEAFARSFFFCRLARFFAVFALAISSASRRFPSNSAASASYVSFISLQGFISNYRIHTLAASSSMILNLSYSRRLLAL